MNVRDVEGIVVGSQVRIQQWYEKWSDRYYAPQQKMLARRMIASVPPELLEQFALEQPEAWEELQKELEEV